MKLIKKSGQAEEFQIEKIRNSIAAANDELDHPVSESAVKNIARDVESIVEGKEAVESWQVQAIVIGLLYRGGFRELLEHYADFK